MCLKTWDLMKGAIGAGKKQPPLQEIHVLPLLLAWLSMWIDSHWMPCHLLLTWEPSCQTVLTEKIRVQQTHPDPTKPSTHFHLALHNPAALSLPHCFLIELSLLSQHENNVKKTVLVVLNY